MLLVLLLNVHSSLDIIKDICATLNISLKISGNNITIDTTKPYSAKNSPFSTTKKPYQLNC